MIETIALVALTCAALAVAVLGAFVSYKQWQEIKIDRDHLLMHKQAKIIAQGIIREIERRERTDT